MSSSEKFAFLSISIAAIVLLQWFLCELGEPRSVWFFNLTGVGQ